MEKTSLYQNILETILTKTQADDFLMKLDNITDSMFDVKESIPTKLSRFLPQDKKEKILLALEQNNIRIDDLNSMQSFLTGLKNMIKNLPVVDLQIACDINDSNLHKILAWFSRNLKQKALVNITVKNNLLGGAIIGFNGIYKDITLKKELEEKYAKLSVLSQNNR